MLLWLFSLLLFATSHVELDSSVPISFFSFLFALLRFFELALSSAAERVYILCSGKSICVSIVNLSNGGEAFGHSGRWAAFCGKEQQRFCSHSHCSKFPLLIVSIFECVRRVFYLPHSYTSGHHPENENHKNGLNIWKCHCHTPRARAHTQNINQSNGT